jgi:hypothetical protein
LPACGHFLKKQASGTFISYSLARLLLYLSAPGLPAGSCLAKAIAAVHRSAFSRLEGYFRVFAALGANGREHLARSAATAGTVPFGLPGLPAGRAPLGLVGVAFGLEEFLLRGAEGERGAAISTLK